MCRDDLDIYRISQAGFCRCSSPFTVSSLSGSYTNCLGTNIEAALAGGLLSVILCPILSKLKLYLAQPHIECLSPSIFLFLCFTPFPELMPAPRRYSKHYCNDKSSSRSRYYIFKH